MNVRPFLCIQSNGCAFRAGTIPNHVFATNFGGGLHISKDMYVNEGIRARELRLIRSKR